MWIYGEEFLKELKKKKSNFLDIYFVIFYVIIKTNGHTSSKSVSFFLENLELKN